MDLASNAAERNRLLQAAQLGDPSALPELIDSESEFLAEQVKKRLGPPLRDILEPEDALQEVRIKILRSTESVVFEDVARLRGWLSTVVRNCMIDLHRRHFRTIRRPPVPRSFEEVVAGSATLGMGLHARQSGPSSIARQSEREIMLRRILVDLKPDQRRLLERVHFEHQRLADIAAQDGDSAGTVRMRYHRALEACRRLMERLTKGAGA